jgi:hypothetical protein
MTCIDTNTAAHFIARDIGYRSRFGPLGAPSVLFVCVSSGFL